MYLIDHERTHNSQAHTWLKSQLIESLQNAIAQNNFYLLVSIKCLAKKKSLVNITTVMLTPTQKATKLWPFLHLPPRIKSQYNCLFNVYFPGQINFSGLIYVLYVKHPMKRVFLYQRFYQLLC
jgi:hypothetical protein